MVGEALGTLETEVTPPVSAVRNNIEPGTDTVHTTLCKPCGWSYHRIIFEAGTLQTGQ